MAPPVLWQAAIGRYPHTAALLDGRVTSELLRLNFAALPTANRAFAPMVRQLRYDVSEMAIATFLQARAAGVRITLLPVVLAARFQEMALFCRGDSALTGPTDLVGRRVGLRGYGQTTGMWLRGILAESYGITPHQIQWVTFEDAHVAGIPDPPGIERAPPGSDMMGLLRDGALDAMIVGNDPPKDPALRSVFPDPGAAAAAFWARHGVMPVNHLLTVKQDLAEQRPDLMMELVRLFAAARDGLEVGRGPLQTSLELAYRYSAEQGLLSGPLAVDEIWDGCPPALAGLEGVA